jgi:hypothetical protein
MAGWLIRPKVESRKRPEYALHSCSLRVRIVCSASAKFEFGDGDGRQPYDIAFGRVAATSGEDPPASFLPLTLRFRPRVGDAQAPHHHNGRVGIE